ncbi:MAG: 16S rRNA (guanine(527)-N(7))-methyltransferase RsmG [Victivallales bacterium]|nr:16S rRNA (guanine(527)-N(7))-methyltransferase RsmG [Victivallales bacterium]
MSSASPPNTPDSDTSDSLAFPLEVLNSLTHTIPNTRAFAARFAKLRELLVAENAKSNLTRIVEPEEYWIKHVFDSLLIADAYPAIFADGAQFADLGCGAGFPALVLAAAFPRIRVTAIDSRGKKTTFVSKAADFLGLSNLSVVTGRGRELARRTEFKNRFNVVVARAVAETTIVFRETRAMLAPDSDIILYKARESAETEIRDIRAEKTAVSFDWTTSELFLLPKAMGERVFIRGARKTTTDKHG